MTTALTGTELAKVIRALPRRVKACSHYTDQRLALFNAWKHCYTNYQETVTQEVFRNIQGLQQEKARLKQIYQKLYQLAGPEWRPQCQRAYEIALGKLQWHRARWLRDQGETQEVDCYTAVV